VLQDISDLALHILKLFFECLSFLPESKVISQVNHHSGQLSAAFSLQFYVFYLCFENHQFLVQLAQQRVWQLL